MHWLFFAAVAALGLFSYNVSVRLAGDHMNAFLFGIIMTVAALILHSVAYFIYIYIQNIPAALPKQGTSFAVLAGVAVFLLDMALFFMLQKNGGLSISVPLVFVVAIGLTAIAGIYFFSETVETTTVIGIIMAVFSIGLLIK